MPFLNDQNCLNLNALAEACSSFLSLNSSSLWAFELALVLPKAHAPSSFRVPTPVVPSLPNALPHLPSNPPPIPTLDHSTIGTFQAVLDQG